MGKGAQRWDAGWRRRGLLLSECNENTAVWNKRGRKPYLAPGRTQVTPLRAPKQEHPRKPEEFAGLIGRCSSSPFLGLFARGDREGWDMWGNQAIEEYEPAIR